VLRSGTREIIEHYTGVTDLTADELDRLLATPGPRDVAALLNRRAHVGWTTGGHTATDVPLYATGPGADRFRGHHDNTAIGQMLAALLDVDLAALTDQQRSRTVRS
jgi:alkaline phosphatase